MIKVKCANQRFKIGYKSKKKNFIRAFGMDMKTIIVKIEGRELKEKELSTPH